MMKKSVERKIASVAEKMKGINYLYDNWATANIRLDNIEFPVMINVLPVSGKFAISRTQLRDCPNCMIAFADKTTIDFDGVENNAIIERCKEYATQFIIELNKSGLFDWVSDEIPYSIFYDKLDVSITGIMIELKLKETAGVSIC